MLGRFWRWLRTTPQVRWHWPRTVFRPPERRAGPAHLVALRFTTALYDELQIRNDGPGDAGEITLTVLRRDPAGAEQRSSGRLASLGAGNRYILSLRPDTRRTPPSPTEPPQPETPAPQGKGPGRWVHLRWRDPAGDPAGQPRESNAFAAWDAPPTGPLRPPDQARPPQDTRPPEHDTL